MPQDTFYTQDNCDRCGENINNTGRKMSWFTEETICMKCAQKEDEIRSKLHDQGKSFEGCGFIPIIAKISDGQEAIDAMIKQAREYEC